VGDPVSVLQEAQEAIERYGMLNRGGTVILGISGGIDSLCLLSVMRALATEYEISLHVGHLNHGIRREAARDAEWVQDQCRRWAIGCTVGTEDVPTLARERGLSLEETARQARYAFLAAVARELNADTVAVGHNADDQAETVLMHLLRGAGLAGLRGMRPVAWLDEERPSARAVSGAGRERVRLVRPLLTIPRAELELYAAEQGLKPVEDVTNADTAYLRNRIRHELLPLLQDYNPSIRAILCRTAEALAGDEQLLERSIRKAWDQIVAYRDSARIVYQREALMRCPDAMRRALLRRGIYELRQSLRDVSWINVRDAIDVLSSGRVGARATLPGGLRLAIGYEQVLLCEDGSTWPLDDRPRMSGALSLTVPGLWLLPDERWAVCTEWCDPIKPGGWLSGAGALHAWLDADRAGQALSLRTRQSGDRLQPLGISGSQTVKKLMIDRRVPAYERDAVPILVSNGRIIWVAGVQIDRECAVTARTARVLHVWFERRHAPKETG